MSDETKLEEQAPTAGFGGLAHSIGVRNLWIIILTMPAVFLVIVASIIMIFGKPGEAEDAAPESAAAVEPAPDAPIVDNPAPADVFSAAAASPGAIALDGDRLAVRLNGPDGVVVVIYDVISGEEISRIAVTQSEDAQD